MFTRPGVALRQRLPRRSIRPRGFGYAQSGQHGSERGAAIIETVLVLPLLIAVLMATVAFGMGIVAKAIVTNAARDAGRLAAIECGQGDPAWFADAADAASSALGRGLYVAAATPQPARYGQWWFTATCATPGVPGGAVSVTVIYDEVDLFPPLGALLSPGAPVASDVFRLSAGAEFPEE